MTESNFTLARPVSADVVRTALEVSGYEKHHGVSIWTDEDGWGWTASGHPEPRRLMAAINSLAREEGFRGDLLEELSDMSGIGFTGFTIEYKWASHFKAEGGEFSWSWVEAPDPDQVPEDALPFTRITL